MISKYKKHTSMPSGEVKTNYLVIAYPKSQNDSSYTYPV